MLGTLATKLPPPESIGRLTTGQYFRMIETGIIREGAPYELMDGLLVLKDRSSRGESPMSIGKLHNLLIQLLFGLNAELLKFGCYLQTQGPVLLGTDQAPEPDGAIIKGKPDDYKKDFPGASDVFSIIEISDSSLRMDRTTKMRIYATAGIPQYVILNLIDKQVEVHEAPDKAQGVYAKKRVLSMEDKLTLMLGIRKKLTIPVAKLLR